MAPTISMIQMAWIPLTAAILVCGGTVFYAFHVTKDLRALWGLVAVALIVQAILGFKVF